jgi:acetolactate synthase-1/2/3 large subunit
VTNGAVRMWEAAVGAGVSVCFTNPGTTEMPLVAALDEVQGMRPVLCLFEGVATGAADGYARVTGRPATTLLHLGPGLGNGIANLHNAKRAGSPIVNLIGDHPAWHLPADSPLTSDIVSLASPVSAWVHAIPTADAMAADTVDAIRRAYGPPHGISTLIVPVDCQWDPAPAGPIPALAAPRQTVAADDRLHQAAKMLRRGAAAVLFVGGHALEAGGLEAIERIRSATECRVYTEMFSARIDRGRHLPWFRSLPYFAEKALEALADTEALVAAGTRPPVAFFANPGMARSELTRPDCEVLAFDEPGDDVVASLEALADLLDAPPVAVAPREPVELPSADELNPATIGQAVVALLPEHSFVIDEAATSAFGYTTKSTQGPPHSMLGLTGGAIGMGLPLAVGASVGAPGQRVVVLQADGSGMYTNQALWTMAHERLDVTVVVYANHKYAILQHELARAGHPQPGPRAANLTNLSDPQLSYASLAEALGVPATRATTTSEFVEQFQASLRTTGPALIEALI